MILGAFDGVSFKPQQAICPKPLTSVVGERRQTCIHSLAQARNTKGSKKDFKQRLGFRVQGLVCFRW